MGLSDLRGNLKARIAGWVASVGLGAALIVACSSTPAVTAKTDCKPGDAYYCRCPDRQEGTRVCNDDGTTYGACEPCFPADPPAPEEDGSFPTEDVFVPPSDAGEAGDGGPCPNGTVDPGEQCDDGNRTPNDGCSTTCTLEGGPTVGDKCPGMAVHVWDKPVTFTGTTISAIDDYSAAPDCTGPANGFGSPDRVFAITAHRAGTLRVTTTATNFAHMIYRADSCAPAGRSFAQIGCSNATGNGNEILTFPATVGTTYYVVIDGGATGQQQGNFTLTFAIP